VGDQVLRRQAVTVHFNISSFKHFVDTEEIVMVKCGAAGLPSSM
jgi:hypothetical protein